MDLNLFSLYFTFAGPSTEDRDLSDGSSGEEALRLSLIIAYTTPRILKPACVAYHSYRKL